MRISLPKLPFCVSTTPIFAQGAVPPQKSPRPECRRDPACRASCWRAKHGKTWQNQITIRRSPDPRPSVSSCPACSFQLGTQNVWASSSACAMMAGVGSTIRNTSKSIHLETPAASAPADRSWENHGEPGAGHSI